MPSTTKCAAARLLPCAGGFLLALVAGGSALDNGFSLPALGWSSWYAAPHGSQVTDAFVRASAKALISSGLAKKGYKYVNVDEGECGGHVHTDSAHGDGDVRRVRTVRRARRARVRAAQVSCVSPAAAARAMSRHVRLPS
jgi:hypothetical protein